jgi:hypothetical protein
MEHLTNWKRCKRPFGMARKRVRLRQVTRLSSGPLRNPDFPGSTMHQRRQPSTNLQGIVLADLTMHIASDFMGQADKVAKVA